MFGPPVSPTVTDMFESAGVSQVRARAESLQRQCFVCSHTEFVHADGTPRWCLFSECGCASYTIDLTSIELRDADRSVA